MAESPTAVVARRMRALRQGKLTAEQLAEAMTAVGIPWQRSIVANLENGRRDAVSVGELFALALVLDVTPSALLVDLDNPSAEVTPDLTVTPLDLLMWLQMKAPLPGHDLDGHRFPPRVVSKIGDVWSEILDLEDIVPPAGADEQNQRARQLLARTLAEQRAVLRDLLSVLGDKVAVPRQISDYLAKHPDEEAAD